MKTIHLLTLIVLLGCDTKTDSTGFVLNAHSMVYHPEEDNIYLFGGANEREVLNDLWVLENNTWEKMETVQRPSPRTFAPMVYDAKKQRIILFGGSKVLFGKEVDASNLLNDTWEFKNQQWNKILTELVPSPRAEAAMVYDPINEKIILFGGYMIRDGQYIKLGDTWEFVDDNWQLTKTEGPSARHGVALGYDYTRQNILLFGGSTTDKQYGASEGESWIFNKQTWSLLDQSRAPGVFNPSMVYNKANNQFIRFGGWNGSTRIDETWIFRNETWQQVYPKISPSPRNHSSMVYHERSGKVILFGGHDGSKVFGDIWEFENNEWRKILDVKPQLRIENHH